MSEKAVGTDWKKVYFPLRHGCGAYRNIDKYNT